MTQPAPVLLVANNFPPVRGGSAAVYANLARCASGRIIVLAPRISYADGLTMIGWREHDRHAGYRIIRLPLLRNPFGKTEWNAVGRLLGLLHDAFIRVRLAWTIGALVLRHGVRTVCVGELLASSWLLGLLRVVPGLRTVAYVHGEEVTTADSYDPDHRRSRRALLAAGRIVVVSRFTLGAVTRLMGPPHAGRLSLIENGVDTSRFNPGARSQSLLDLYHLQGCFVFVSVCRLLEKKGIDHALAAFAAIAADIPDARMLIVGAGPFGEALRLLSTNLGLDERVVFTGAVPEDELVEHYRLGDAFIMPNRELPNGDTEGFGLVFLEANGCGLPVIAGRDGGSTDAVNDGVNGLVVDGGSVGAIAEAMRALHGDAALRARIGQAGRAAAAAADWAVKTDVFLATVTAE